MYLIPSNGGKSRKISSQYAFSGFEKLESNTWGSTTQQAIQSLNINSEPNSLNNHEKQLENITSSSYSLLDSAANSAKFIIS